MGTPYLCIHTYITRGREKQDLIYVNQLQLQLLLFSPHCVCVQRVMQMEPQPKVLNNKRQVVASRCAHEGHPCSQIYLSIFLSLFLYCTWQLPAAAAAAEEARGEGGAELWQQATLITPQRPYDSLAIFCISFLFFAR